MALIVPEAVFVRVGVELHHVAIHVVSKMRTVDGWNKGVDPFGNIVITDLHVGRVNAVTIPKAMFEISGLDHAWREFGREGYEVVDIHSALATVFNEVMALTTAGRIA